MVLAGVEVLGVGVEPVEPEFELDPLFELVSELEPVVLEGVGVGLVLLLGELVVVVVVVVVVGE